MKILIDIEHMADINFYKNAITLLRKHGHHVYVTALDRGRIVDVLRKEYDTPVYKLGKHYKKFSGKLYGICERTLLLMKFMLKHNIDLATAYGFYGPLAASLLGKKSVAFYDDYEYKKKFRLCKHFSTRFVIPPAIPARAKNIQTCHSLKELAYLHPKYFKPSISALKPYGLKKDSYVFIREVSAVSVNYYELQKKSYQDIINYCVQKKIPVVVSLEDKSRRDEFKDCIVLEEPVADLYSLMAYSACMISTGDTMIRESALLGVPSLYLGGRDMLVNHELIALGLVEKIDTFSQVTKRMKEILKLQHKKVTQKILKKHLDTWESMTDAIVHHLEDVAK